ncbi:LytTR family transcriptional regulator DNA-binding domain-containing protein [Paenibacillus sp. 22594]|uniref:LytTR family transcriptional regulator DNA-binding domain-containing protein n=1 Tax=Paenibacillus sp. 22594 TaxID=3453947 RepID=UPI003F83EC8A
MDTISVTRDIEGKTGLITVRIDEIIYLGTDSRTAILLLHTLDSVYFTAGTLKYWTQVLNASGYCFLLADRNNSINIRRIVEINKLLKVAYFEPESERNKASKYSTMSKSGLKEVLQVIAELDSTVVFT